MADIVTSFPDLTDETTEGLDLHVRRRDGLTYVRVSVSPPDGAAPRAWEGPWAELDDAARAGLRAGVAALLGRLRKEWGL